MTSKFKVGDKVRLLNGGYVYPLHGFMNGEIYEVVGETTDNFNGDERKRNKLVNNGKFGYALPCDLELIESKQTKNQRITALEETVAEQGEEINELKLIVAQIRKPSTVVEEALATAATSVEDIIEFEGKQYKKVNREAREGDVVIIKRTSAPYWLTVGKPYKTYECPMDGTLEIKGHNGALNVYDGYQSQHTLEDVDVYELIVEDKPQSEGERLIKQCERHFSPVEKSPNQLRAEMIEKAKSFVDENGGDDYHFDIDENKGTVFAYKVITPGVGRYGVKYGFSKCHPNDVFNADVGKAISFGRAEKLDVSEFEQAVQPTEKVIGQIVSYEYTVNNKGTFEVHEIKKNGVSDKAIYDSDGCWSDDKDCKIINDTNAIYGGGE